MDDNRETVTEEMHPEEKWFKEARNITEDELPDFFERIIHGYNHDYGTACHAVAACALSSAWAACRDVGLSGYQAGFVMWDFIRNWIMSGNKCGMRLIDYDNMLYPQYEDKFDKVIDENTWRALQIKAKENLEKAKEDSYIHPNVLQHWKNIANGKVPFGYRVVDRI